MLDTLIEVMWITGSLLWIYISVIEAYRCIQKQQIGLYYFYFFMSLYWIWFLVREINA